MRAAGSEKPHRLCLYLPSQERTGAPLAGMERISEEVTREICLHFGGATCYAATGHFTDSGRIQSEAVVVVEFYCSSAELEHRQLILHRLARSLCHRLSQKSIALAIDGSLVLLEA